METISKQAREISALALYILKEVLASDSIALP